MNEVIVTRHSLKPRFSQPESPLFPGLTESGVDLARQRAVDIATIVRASQPRSLFFLAGVSDLPRTASTARIYGDELEHIFQRSKDHVMVLTQDEIVQLTGQSREATERVLKIVQDNPDLKIVVTYPLFLKQLSMIKEGIIDDKGNDTPLIAELFKKNHGDEFGVVRDWIKREQEGENISPKASDVAKNYLRALERLNHFIRSHIGDRPATTFFVGHSMAIDVFLNWITGGGSLDVHRFERMSGGKVISPTELVSLVMENNLAQIRFRGKTYSSQSPTT